MGKDLLSNLVSAGASMLPKSFLYSNKEDRGGKRKQCREPNEEHSVSGAFTVLPRALQRLQVDLKREFGQVQHLQLTMTHKPNEGQQYYCHGSRGWNTKNDQGRLNERKNKVV